MTLQAEPAPHLELAASPGPVLDLSVTAAPLLALEASAPVSLPTARMVQALALGQVPELPSLPIPGTQLAFLNGLLHSGEWPRLDPEDEVTLVYWTQAQE